MVLVNILMGVWWCVVMLLEVCTFVLCVRAGVLVCIFSSTLSIEENQTEGLGGGGRGG